MGTETLYTSLSVFIEFYRDLTLIVHHDLLLNCHDVIVSLIAGYVIITMA
jgi:hypothetical protein